MQARLPRGPKNWPLKVCPQCGTAFGPKPGYGAKDWQRVKHCSFKCMGLSRRVPLATRLQRNARRNPQNGCLEWTGWRDYKGYGRVGADEIGEALAHRAAYIVANGPLIPGLHVLHRCDNPPCIEPTHLYAGTNDDNTRDRCARTYGAQERVGLLVGVLRKIYRGASAELAMAALPADLLQAICADLAKVSTDEKMLEAMREST